MRRCQRRVALLTSLAAAFVEPDPCGEAVLLGERHRQLEEVGATAVVETVSVEVRGCESYVDFAVDLCPQLALDVGQPRFCEERALGRRVDRELVRVGVEQ